MSTPIAPEPRAYRSRRPARARVGRPHPLLILLAAFGAIGVLTVVLGAAFLGFLWLGRPQPAMVGVEVEPPRLVVGGEEMPVTLSRQGNGALLLPWSAARELLGAQGMWEPGGEGEEGTLIVTTPGRVLEMRTGELTAWLNGEPLDLRIPVRALPAEGGESEPHVPIDLLEALYGVRFEVHAGTGRVVLTGLGEDRLADEGVRARVGSPSAPAGTLRARLERWAARWESRLARLGIVPEREDGAPLHERPHAAAPIRRWLGEGTEVRLFGEEQGWVRARTADGVTGYLPRWAVSLVPGGSSPEAAGPPSDGGAGVEAEGTGLELPPPVRWEGRRPGRPLSGERVVLAWEQVEVQTPDPAGIGDLPGVNVVAPTWFVLASPEGHFRSRADARYVAWAHERGIEVWGVATNDFDPDLTAAALSTRERRREMIRQLLAYAALYRLDGINLDFENLHPDDRDRLTQFVRELAPLAHEQGISLSIDVTIKSSNPNYSLIYDRRALAEAVDYVALMAYDEHWATSPRAGSVASLPWVEAGLRGVLEEVPAGKLLLGVPFYTRIWRERSVEGGGTEVSSIAVTMSRAWNLVREHGAEVIWDESAQQHYAEFMDGPVRNRVWLEDEESMAARMALVQRYDLAGMAAWRRGYERETIWPLIETAMSRWP